MQFVDLSRFEPGSNGAKVLEISTLGVQPSPKKAVGNLRLAKPCCDFKLLKDQHSVCHVFFYHGKSRCGQKDPP